MLKKVSLLAVLVLVLMAGAVMAAQPAADGSVAWPSNAAPPVLDYSEFVGGEWGLDPGEVALERLDWGCYYDCMLHMFVICYETCMWWPPTYGWCMGVCMAGAAAGCAASCW